MANSYTLTSDWTTANQFDVTGDRDVLVSNTCAFDIRWALGAAQLHDAVAWTRNRDATVYSEFRENLRCAAPV